MQQEIIEPEDKKIKLSLDKIVLKQELYPREKISQEKIIEYQQYIGVLPPVTVNQDNILIDGFHRYYAYKNSNQKEIEIKIINTVDDDDLFLKAIELNAQHGFPLSNKEKKDLVIRLYYKTIDNSAKSFDIKRLKKTFSIPDSTFSDWTKNINDELESQRLEKILDLYLQCYTQQQIADKIGLAERTIYAKIKEMNDFIYKFAEITDSESLHKYGFLTDKLQYNAEFIPIYYNHHYINILNDDNYHFGRFPLYYMENLLYYYTNPFDIVYDPFAGGGTTIDACKKWLRKYYCSDLNPIEIRNDIKKWNILDGLPDDLPKPNFVFLDPPYWLQAKNEYSKDKNDLSNMELTTFYNTIENFIKLLRNKIDNGYVAFVISPTQYRNVNHNFEDHIIKIINIFEKNKFIENMRYVFPYNTQQYNGNQVDIMKKEKKPLSILRDLVVFKK